jgi:hypothetical protein
MEELVNGGHIIVAEDFLVLLISDIDLESYKAISEH